MTRNSTKRRYCVEPGCPADISHRGRAAQRCEPCAKERSRRQSQAYRNGKREKYDAYTFVTKHFPDAGVRALSEYGSLASDALRSRAETHEKRADLYAAEGIGEKGEFDRFQAGYLREAADWIADVSRIATAALD